MGYRPTIRKPQVRKKETLWYLGVGFIFESFISFLKSGITSWELTFSKWRCNTPSVGKSQTAESCFSPVTSPMSAGTLRWEASKHHRFQFTTWSMNNWRYWLSPLTWIPYPFPALPFLKNTVILLYPFALSSCSTTLTKPWAGTSPHALLLLQVQSEVSQGAPYIWAAATVSGEVVISL